MPRSRQPGWVTAVALACIGVWTAIAWLARPGLVYAKLQTDAAVYLAQARHLWYDGSANHIVVGDGMAPIVYAPLAAYLRAPLFGLTSDPDTLVRLVQAQNIVLLVLLGWLSTRYLVAKLPSRASPAWLALPWLLLTATYNPWALNAALPLGDHLYALLTMGALLLGAKQQRDVLGSPGRSRLAVVAAMIALGVAQKFTSLALLPALAAPALRRIVRRSPRKAAALAVLLLAASAGLAWLLLELISFYAQGAWLRYFDGKAPSEVALNTMTNLLVAALPNQIVPNFSYLFHRDFSATHAVLFGDLTHANTLAATIGLGLSATIVTGAWAARRSMLPELVLFVLVTPIYAIVSNSTSRYLASLQPVFVVWLFFGMDACRTRLRTLMPEAETRRRWRRGSTIAACLAVAGGIAAAGPNLIDSFTKRHDYGVAQALGFLDDLARGFTAGRAKLESIAPAGGNALLLYEADDLRWYPIDGVRYVAPELAAGRLCDGRDVYVVHVCDIRNCARLDRVSSTDAQAPTLRGLARIPVYGERASWGRFEIEQLKLADAGVCQTAPRSHAARTRIVVH